jgi:Protein of unknown function (DUF2752)
MNLPEIAHEHRVLNAVLAGVLSLAILAPLTVKLPGARPSFARFWSIPHCAVRQRTGHPCPTCGLTRSIVALYRGKWSLSRSYHPAGYLVVLFVVLELAARFGFTRARAPWLVWGDIGQLFFASLALGVALIMRV